MTLHKRERDLGVGIRPGLVLGRIRRTQDTQRHEHLLARGWVELELEVDAPRTHERRVELVAVVGGEEGDETVRRGETWGRVGGAEQRPVPSNMFKSVEKSIAPVA